MRALIVLAFAACTSPEPPTEQDYEEVSKAVGTVTERSISPNNGMLQTATAVARGEGPAWLKPSQGGIHLGTLLGLNFEVDIRCTPVPCGPGATGATASFVVGGEFSLFGWTGSFDVTANVEVTGLFTPVVSVSASAAITLGSEFREWFRPVVHQTSFEISVETSTTIDSTSSMPISGSSRFAIEYTRSSSDSDETGHFLFEVEAAIANGIVTFELDGIGYRIDLRTGRVERI